MTIKQTLEENLKTAMRAHDEDGKRVCRMALSSIKFVEKENGKALTDDEIIPILQKELKIRKETLQEAIKGAREETITETQKDIAALEALLPKQLSPDELSKIVKETIDEVGAKSAADMGKVMKAIMPKVKGLAPNDTVSKMVKELLS